MSYKTAQYIQLRINHIIQIHALIFSFITIKSESLLSIPAMLTTVKSIGDFQVLALIGDGGQANVYLCSRNNELAAVKVFNAGSHKNEPFQRQTRFLSVIKHSNLIAMSGAEYEAVVKNADGTSFKRSIIVLEFAQNGDLFEYISVTKAFKPEFCRTIFMQLLDGIEYLNQQGIAHRDLKPENVLFNDKYQLKITDFGLSAYSEGTEKDFVLTTKVGTEGFKAPEVDNGKYNGLKADIFAIGVILFCLYAGSPPFLTTRASDKMYRFILNRNFDKFWSIHEKNRVKGYFSAGFKSLINSLLIGNPEQRMTIQEIKQHSWLKQINANSEELKSQLNLRFQKIVEESELKKNIIELLKKREECSALKDQGVMQQLLTQVKNMDVKDIQTEHAVQKIETQASSSLL